MIEVYKYVNEILIKDYDNTYKNGSKYINIVIISYDLLEHVKECKLVNYEEIIHSNCRGYLVDISIIEYFEYPNSCYDKINKITLNLFKRSYIKKFVQMIKDYMNRLKIEDILEEVEK